MTAVVDKVEILKLLRERVSADLATMSAAQRAVVDGATHEENRPENDKDTRALEQSYLARGQAQRVVELQEPPRESQPNAAIGARNQNVLHVARLLPRICPASSS